MSRHRGDAPMIRLLVDRLAASSGPVSTMDLADALDARGTADDAKVRVYVRRARTMGYAITTTRGEGYELHDEAA